jgi:hypothetical protein
MAAKRKATTTASSVRGTVAVKGFKSTTSASVSLNEEIPDEPIAGSCFRWENGVKREFTPEEYAATPRGRIFIGIGGFKPPAGKIYKPAPI